MNEGEYLWHAGLGKADITAFDVGMAMFGWGHADNIARGVAKPLYARALALQCPRTGARAAYVCAELGFISQHLRQMVLERAAPLGLGEHSLMLTATHTHSGPSGYSAYFLYSVGGPGFSRRIAERLADGIVAALHDAFARLAPARLRWGVHSIPLSEPVAFNRALDAYNQNFDVDPVEPGRSDEAVERNLSLLRIESPSGRPRGLLCWFGVHGTSVHSDNELIHSDNKGIAAERCEHYALEQFGESEDPFVAVFAQECAGDVTPNFRWSEQRKLLIGRYDDDFASAELNGTIQARAAFRALLDAGVNGELLRAELVSRTRYRDFSQLEVHPDFAFGRQAQRTSKACLGFGFAFGTLEGPGPAFAFRNARAPIAALTRYYRRRRSDTDWRAMHGPKARMVDLGLGERGHMLKWLSCQTPVFRYVPDERVRYYSRVLDAGCLAGRPWAPEILPIQIFRVGALAIAALPVEPTTHSGRRLRAALGGGLASAGVRHTVVNSHANAYASYVTTYEEYQLQHYEAASTLFGEWTLAAFCTEVRALARDLCAPAWSELMPSSMLELLPPRYADEPLLPA